jgi:hypothetical protein
MEFDVFAVDTEVRGFYVLTAPALQARSMHAASATAAD